jgi:hypothetical protein
MTKRKRKKLTMRREDAPRLPKPTKKRRFRARWRPHEIVYW